MSAISSLVVSETVLQKDRGDEADTPTTPRASRQPNNSTQEETSNIPYLEPSPLLKQEYPAPNINHGPENVSLLVEDQSSIDADQVEQKSDVMDIDISDNELDGSDNDTEQGDGDAASKKKKGQRFFCTGYPPCSLSFTRSEHLARHIRKHTGERPFQCHCNRRFSRLDNLRQHAQTVHVNEEIPTDSLAATGTRFQRQIRTDRVRPAGRPRTGSMSASTPAHSRGHSRNLSASSVGSTSSNYSTVTEAKRRPPPLLMANDNSSRPKLTLDPPSTPPAQYRGFRPGSPTGLGTPTSATFSATPGSPGYGSSIGSPISTNSRLGGFLGSRTPGRRLSVPSAPNPFHPHYSNSQTTTYMMQMPQSGSQSSANSSLFTSPTSSTFSYSQGYHIPPSEDWRRRTWHPSTYQNTALNYGRPATSGLTYSQTPDAPQPAFAQHATAAAAQAPRLPGIESFDHFQHRPTTPPRRQASPMLVDSHHSEPFLVSMGSNNDPHARPVQSSWAGPSGYSEVDAHGGNKHGPGSWSQQTMSHLQSVGRPIHEPRRSVDMAPPPPTNFVPSQQSIHVDSEIQRQSSTRRAKRQAWYNGPVSATRTSPEDSSSSDGVPTPGTSTADVHPIIVHSNGYPESQHAVIPADGQHTPCLPPRPVPSHMADVERERTITHYDHNTVNDMNRLEALVAVATSGENSTNSVR